MEHVHQGPNAQTLVARSTRGDSLTARSCDCETGAAIVKQELKETSHELVAVKQERGVAKRELSEARREFVEASKSGWIRDKNCS